MTTILITTVQNFLRNAYELDTPYGEAVPYLRHDECTDVEEALEAAITDLLITGASEEEVEAAMAATLETEILRLQEKLLDGYDLEDYLHAFELGAEMDEASRLNSYLLSDLRHTLRDLFNGAGTQRLGEYLENELADEDSLRAFLDFNEEAQQELELAASTYLLGQYANYDLFSLYNSAYENGEQVMTWALKNHGPSYCLLNDGKGVTLEYVVATVEDADCCGWVDVLDEYYEAEMEMVRCPDCGEMTDCDRNGRTEEHLRTILEDDDTLCYSCAEDRIRNFTQDVQAGHTSLTDWLEENLDYLRTDVDPLTAMLVASATVDQHLAAYYAAPLRSCLEAEAREARQVADRRYEVEVLSAKLPKHLAEEYHEEILRLRLATRNHTGAWARIDYSQNPYRADVAHDLASNHRALSSLLHEATGQDALTTAQEALAIKLGLDPAKVELAVKPNSTQWAEEVNPADLMDLLEAYGEALAEAMAVLA